MNVVASGRPGQEPSHFGTGAFSDVTLGPGRGQWGLSDHHHALLTRCFPDSERSTLGKAW